MTGKFLQDPQCSKIMEWYSCRDCKVTPIQFLLAREYLTVHRYPLDIACLLALDSYREN